MALTDYKFTIFFGYLCNMFNSIKDFASHLEKGGQLIKSGDKVLCKEDLVAAVSAETSSENGGRAMLFSETGSDYKILANIFGNAERLEKAFGNGSEERYAGKVGTLTSALLRNGSGWQSKREAISTAFEILSWQPRPHKGHPACHDSIQNIARLSQLPALDLAMACVCSPDAKNAEPSLEPCSLSFVNETTAAIQIGSNGDTAKNLADCTHRLPIAVIIGGDPVVWLTSVVPTLKCVNPYTVSGFFRGGYLELTQCFTQKLQVPSSSDFVLEGYIQKSEEPLEDGRRNFHLTCITHRHDAIMPVLLPSEASSEKRNVCQAVEKIFVEPARQTNSQIEELLLLSKEILDGSH